MQVRVATTATTIIMIILLICSGLPRGLLGGFEEGHFAEDLGGPLALNLATRWGKLAFSLLSIIILCSCFIISTLSLFFCYAGGLLLMLMLMGLMCSL